MAINNFSRIGNKKLMLELKRLGMEMVQIILNELTQSGKRKRTSLALSCKIPYDRFTKYLSMMIRLELLVIEKNDDVIFVNITELGKKFLAESS